MAPGGPSDVVLVHSTGCAVDLHAVYREEPRLKRTWRGRSLVLPLVPLLPPGERAVELVVESAPFVAPGEWCGALARPLAALSAHPNRHDGTLTALLELSTEAGGTHRGRVAPVSYFCTRALESLLDGPHDLRAADQPQPGKLSAPRESVLACDIGVVVLLRTADGAVVAQRRSDRVDWRAGHLSVSASGSLEPGRDFSCPVVGLDGLLAGARRELAEELGVGGPTDPAREALELWSLGIWRELERGGKPELYSLAHTPLSFDEVCRLHRDAPDAAESVELRALDRADRAGLIGEVARGDGALGRPGGPFGPIDLALVASLLLAEMPAG